MGFMGMVDGYPSATFGGAHAGEVEEAVIVL